MADVSSLEGEMERREITTLDRLKSNFPVTLGVCLTGGALAYGIRSMGSSASGAQQNAGMSARVGLQGATLATIVGYALYTQLTKESDELEQRRVFAPPTHQ